MLLAVQLSDEILLVEHVKLSVGADLQVILQLLLELEASECAHL